MATITCPNCGDPNANSAWKNCHKCGQPMDGKSASTVAVQATPSSPNGNFASAKYGSAASKQTVPVSKTKLFFMLFAFGIAGAIVGAIVGEVFHLGGGTNVPTGGGVGGVAFGYGILQARGYIAKPKAKDR